MSVYVRRYGNIVRATEFALRVGKSCHDSDGSGYDGRVTKDKRGTTGEINGSWIGMIELRGTKDVGFVDANSRRASGAPAFCMCLKAELLSHPSPNTSLVLQAPLP